MTSRADGMLNVLTGLGDPTRDKSEAVGFYRRTPLDPWTLDALYEQQGLAARLVDVPADEMTREGFDLDKLDGVKLDAVESAIEDHQLLEQVADLHRWGDHYGGALLIGGFDDGLSPEMPLDLTRIRKVVGLAVVDRWCCEPVTLHGVKAPEAYLLNGMVDVPVQGRVVHASRVLKHVGTRVSPRRRPDVRWWGVPRIERVWQEFRRVLVTQGYSEALVHDLSVDVFAISGLAEALLAGREDVVRKRLLALQMGKSILKGIVLDAGSVGSGGERKPETYSPTARPVAGLPDLLEVFIRTLCLVTGWPRSKLIGETVGGLNTGTNSGETRDWYAGLKSTQNRRLTPWVNWYLTALFSSREGPTRGRLPPSWTVCWRPLWSPTELEQEQARKTRAEADGIYVQMGAATPEMVWDTRFKSKSTGELQADSSYELPPIGGEPDASEQSRARAIEEQEQARRT